MLLKSLDQDRATPPPRFLEILKGLAPDVAQSFTELLESPELVERAGEGIDSRITSSSQRALSSFSGSKLSRRVKNGPDWR
jgi:hypothetical protein